LKKFAAAILSSFGKKLGRSKKIDWQTLSKAAAKMTQDSELKFRMNSIEND
jgi:hypothetical protein